MGERKKHKNLLPTNFSNIISPEWKISVLALITISQI